MSQQRRRYPGLNYFTTEQKDQFFGRDAEKEDLLALVQTEKIVALFGKSGYGKSSLIRAGLISLLPPNVLPINVCSTWVCTTASACTTMKQGITVGGISAPADFSAVMACESIWC